MTVLIYVDILKQVENPEHLKVFADAAAAETWFVENLAALGKGRASSASSNERRSNTRFRSEPAFEPEKTKRKARQPAGRSISICRC